MDSQKVCFNANTDIDSSQKDMLGLYKLLEKLESEADKAIKNIEAMKKKGTDAVCKVNSVFAASIKPAMCEQTKQTIFKLTERLVELNCDLELAEDDLVNLEIPYICTKNPVELKFLTGDNPWNFWLFDDKVDTKTLHKILLKKYQNELLELHPHATPLESVCFFDRNKVFRGIVQQTVNENRVKVLDCDSNIIKVVPNDRVFKADPDACHVHASAIKCTITKDSIGVDLWDTSLRDIFCNNLKEATLNVRVLERLSGSLPSFLVDIEMRNEDENLSTNLKEWVIDRLIPELKKVIPQETESVCDFLSSEALDPYYKESLNVKQEIIKGEGKDCSNSAVFPGISSIEENNLNSFTEKVSLKIVTNVDHGDEMLLTPETSDMGAVSSSSEKVLSLSNSVGETVVSSKSIEFKTNFNHKNIQNKAILDTKSSGSSHDCLPIKPNAIPTIVNQRPNHPKQSRCFPPKFNTSVGYPAYSQYPDPYFPPHDRSNIPSWSYIGTPLQQVPNVWNQPPQFFPQGVPQWNGIGSDVVGVANIPQTLLSETKKKNWSPGVESHLTKEESDGNVTISNYNNINVKVNVMAPEFIPKCSNEFQHGTDIQQISTDKTSCISETSVLPTKNENVHIQLRKPSTLLNPGENLLVMISHVESPGEFYIHFVNSNNKYIDKLVDDMYKYYTTKDKVSFSSWNEAKNTLGKFCACKWLQDNHWYRVEVLDWALGDNEVKVYFVDYGNSESVPLSCLQPLTLQYSKLSMCAQPCHLAKIHPLNKLSTWSQQSIDFFKSKVDGETNKNRIYSITVVPSSDRKVKNNSLSVLLYEGKATDDCVSINDHMVDCGMAWSRRLQKRSQSSDSDLYYSLEEVSQLSDTSHMSSDEQKASLALPNGLVKNPLDEEWKKWDPMYDDYTSARNNPRIDTDDACVAVSGYSAKDEARICKFFYRDGFCKKKLCTKEHITPHQDGATTDKEEVYINALSMISLPSLGEQIEVKVTAVLSISLFYVQLKESRAIDLDSDDDEMETLTKLSEFMNRPENVMRMKHLTVSPAVGQLVLTKFDSQWFRARVCSADINPEVMFVDYGSVTTVLETDLREMEARYLHLPFQAIECSLANIIPPEVGTLDYERGTELLRETINSTVLTAKVYNSVTGDIEDEACRLEVLLQLDDGRDVGEWLAGINVCKHLPSITWEM